MLWWAVRGSACCAGGRCGASCLARCAGKRLRVSSAPRPFGFDPCMVNKKDGQLSLTVLICFGGPSGGRTLDLGIKSLECDVLARVISAKLQVPMFSKAQYALKLHWRTVINGYQVMHKTPPWLNCLPFLGHEKWEFAPSGTDGTSTCRYAFSRPESRPIAAYSCLSVETCSDRH